MPESEGNDRGQYLSDATLPFANEQSPLLSKVDNHVSDDLARKKPMPEAAVDGENTRSKVLWIMASMWMGRFCAGLGKR